jgi:hypothetical protein
MAMFGVLWSPNPIERQDYKKKLRYKPEKPRFPS